jgi:hypothetical protein
MVRAVSAPLYHRLLTSDDPLDEAAADRAAEAAVTAARAGLFVIEAAERAEDGPVEDGPERGAG